MPDNPPVRISKSHATSTEPLQDRHDLTSDNPGSSNAASNGYWIHDELGPKFYVAPPETNGLDIDEGEIVKRIDAALGSTAGLETSQIQVALEKGVIVINGITVSAMENQLIARAVQKVTGEVKVVNRLVIDEGLNKNRVSP